mmetsp:Transcript_13683/g.41658  ORF Transcript_13683/g.41658 Transcript_13683/m.41658 type:complete len:225 (-) Transcript_13683:182-856(-)
MSGACAAAAAASRRSGQLAGGGASCVSKNSVVTSSSGVASKARAEVLGPPARDSSNTTTAFAYRSYACRSWLGTSTPCSRSVSAHFSTELRPNKSWKPAASRPGLRSGVAWPVPHARRVRFIAGGGTVSALAGRTMRALTPRLQRMKHGPLMTSTPSGASTPRHSIALRANPKPYKLSGLRFEQMFELAHTMSSASRAGGGAQRSGDGERALARGAEEGLGGHG